MTFTVKSFLFEDSKIRARIPLIWGLHNNPIFILGKMILICFPNWVEKAREESKKTQDQSGAIPNIKNSSCLDVERV